MIIDWLNLGFEWIGGIAIFLILYLLYRMMFKKD